MQQAVSTSFNNIENITVDYGNSIYRMETTLEDGSVSVCAQNFD